MQTSLGMRSSYIKQLNNKLNQQTPSKSITSGNLDSQKKDQKDKIEEVKDVFKKDDKNNETQEDKTNELALRQQMTKLSKETFHNN